MADTLDSVHTRAERLARGWLVGAVATGVAAVSHTLAGGYRPDPLGLGVALVFAGMLGTVAIGRRPSLPRLIVAVGGAQLAFHVLFASLTVPQAEGLRAMTPTMPEMPGMPTTVVAVTPVHVMDHLASPGMWVAHTIAGLLTIVFLRRAETAMWSMLRRLVIRMLLLAAPTPLTRPVAAPLARVRVLHSRHLVAALPLRGPPLLTSH